MNLCEIGLFYIVWGVSKGTRDNYNAIWWKKCFMGGGRRYMVHLHFLFIIHKNAKSTRAWQILKSNLSSFWFKNSFPRMNIKKFTKKGQLLFLYEVSIVVLIDFIAILLTPGIFLIQIVNTNRYLIHFYSKIILKCIFLKVVFYSFKTDTSIHYPLERGEISCVDISKDITTMLQRQISKK